MVEVELVTVRVETPSSTSVMLLRELAGERRLLPILIGSTEAMAIAYALEGVETPRPMTHDLMTSLVVDLGASLERVVVTELRERTFYAELTLGTGNGSKVVSSRPSDAIALAVRSGTPIFVEEAVLAEASYREDEHEADQDVVLDEFKRFIDNVNPEDFAS